MRMVKMIVGDIRFQLKYGFYFIYTVLTVVYITILYTFPPSWRESTASIMIFSDPAAMGLFFMGAIILLEKSQHVLNALAVSPVKIAEYIISKVVSLGLISIIVAGILSLSVKKENLFIVLLAAALTSIIFTLLGLIVGTKIASLNQFLMVTVPVGISIVITIILLLFFNLSQISFAAKILLSVAGALQGLIAALIIVTLSSNKLEGMAAAKLTSLMSLGIMAPFFLQKGTQYLLSPLPSFWMTKGVYENTYLYMTLSFVLSFLWMGFLIKRFTRKTTG